MPRLAPITSKSDVSAEHHAVVDAVQKVFGNIRGKGDAGKLPAEAQAIVTYVRQLMRTNRVDQNAFDALKSRHNAQWLVELTAAANYFALLSGVVNAFEVAAPPDGDTLPA